MAASSQMAASAVTRQFSSDALGINPYRAPRLDEEHPIGLDRHSMTQLASDLWIGISGPAQVRLHDASPPIGVNDRDHAAAYDE